ncbi:MAG: hypothetical protein NTZ16_00955, partial [Verrucomicrobia bacterium]|nr:hypothetical protein [Verrucomicrobiota bacterium]
PQLVQPRDDGGLLVRNLQLHQLAHGAQLHAEFGEQFEHAVAISAATGDGVPELLAELGVQLRPVRELVELKIPHEQAAVIARLHKLGQVIESRYLAKAAKFKARIPPHHHAEFAEFIVNS